MSFIIYIDCFKKFILFILVLHLVLIDCDLNILVKFIQNKHKQSEAGDDAGDSEENNSCSESVSGGEFCIMNKYH